MEDWKDEDFIVEVENKGWKATEFVIEIAGTDEKIPMQQWHPTLFVEHPELGPIEKDLPIRFDSKVECQEFIADFIIATGFHPDEEFE